MPLFELNDASSLVPFRQLRVGADLYEREIEDLLWENFEEVTGESVFKVARQPAIAGGGRPDIVALDHDARVVVVEVKRDVDRSQLAQCLEYAGWGRTTNLDELAGLYHRGPSAFFADWQEFMDSAAPVRIRRSPRLILVARDFHGRTGSAFEFLLEHGLPVKLIRVALYEDADSRRFVDVEGEHEPDFVAEGAGEGGTEAITPTRVEGRRVRLSDLIDAGLLKPGDALIWDRPRLGVTYRASISEAGGILLEDGREFAAPSRAAVEAAQIPAYDGWYAWRLDSPEGPTLHALRVDLAQRLDDDVPNGVPNDAVSGATEQHSASQEVA